LLAKVMPEGKAEGVHPAKAAFENEGAGLADAVVWKLLAAPTKKVVELALVIVGVPEPAGARLTLRVNVWVAAPEASVASMQTV
jgi:hypothetical protein